MNITAKQVSELRDRTGVGMMEAKSALLEAGGDVEKAIELLRKKGQLKAQKKAARTANQGIIDAYIHGEGRIGVLIEVNSETDFVARNDEFKKLVHDLALHVAASSPLYVSRDQVPAELVAKEKEIYAERARAEGKPANIIDKITEGRVEKYYQEVCLLEQSFVKDQDITVRELVERSIAKIGENIQVKRFTRYVLGE